MESNLTPEYIQFINDGGNINNFVQNIIDRVQYQPNFLQELSTLINKYEDPFEVVEVKEINDAAFSEMKIMAVEGKLTEKRLKPEFCK